MQALPSYIHFTDHPSDTIAELLQEMNPDKVAILVDENTKKFCLEMIPTEAAQIIEIHSGEKHKTLETCTDIWYQMTQFGMSRKSLLINLGGGVIGDMGGFVASTYKRGIRFVNIPTTLLSQVDASIGGKLGIDFQGLKNHVGIFRDPDAVILSNEFLKTLESRQLRSGFAEVIKHGLIWDKKYFETIRNYTFPTNVEWPYLLRRSVEIKGEVVSQDPLEQGLRKILNFGHTLGHAVETYHLENHIDILHGEAIAIGMIMEMHLSMQKGWIDETDLNEISHWLIEIFGHLGSVPDTEPLIRLMSHDKKNEADRINFSLLKNPGECTFDIQVEQSMIEKATNYYKTLKGSNK
jgi:3-dehydroquinate synthase